MAGAVSSVLLPGNKNSAGAQFFICVVPQRRWTASTMFGKVVEGIGIAQLISETPVDEAGKAATRVEMTSVTIRDALPPGVEPFSTEPVEELASYRATLETSLGAITLELLPEKAPNTVRNFLRLASTGVYDRTSFHRVVPAFMIQAGYLGTKQVPMDESQKALVRTLEPEFNDTPHEKGVVSMARGQTAPAPRRPFHHDYPRFLLRRHLHGVCEGRRRHERRRGHRAGASGRRSAGARIDLLRVRVSKK